LLPSIIHFYRDLSNAHGFNKVYAMNQAGTCLALVCRC